MGTVEKQAGGTFAEVLENFSAKEEYNLAPALLAVPSFILTKRSRPVKPNSSSPRAGLSMSGDGFGSALAAGRGSGIEGVLSFLTGKALGELA
jgi:hypothetical protein